MDPGRRAYEMPLRKTGDRLAEHSCGRLFDYDMNENGRRNTAAQKQHPKEQGRGYAGDNIRKETSGKDEDKRMNEVERVGRVAQEGDYVGDTAVVGILDKDQAGQNAGSRSSPGDHSGQLGSMCLNRRQIGHDSGDDQGA